MCKGLGLEMTAEGIERPQQLAMLAEHQSIHLQGYLISRPLPVDQVIAAQRCMPQLLQDLLLSASQVRASTERNDRQAMGNVAQIRAARLG